jgi:hypothetical protein
MECVIYDVAEALGIILRIFDWYLCGQHWSLRLRAKVGQHMTK